MGKNSKPKSFTEAIQEIHIASKKAEGNTHVRQHGGEAKKPIATSGSNKKSTK